MDSESESVSEVNRLYQLLSAQISALQAIGYTVLIQAPKNSVLFCLKVQKEIICFPFRCLRSAYNSVRNALTTFERPERPQQRPSPPQIAEMLTGSRNPDMQQILRATREIRQAAMHTILNQNSMSRRFAEYREEVDRWATETDKTIEDTVTLTSNDKELVRKLADVVKFLRSMRSKKIKVTDTYLKQLMFLISKDQISHQELLVLKENFQRLSSLTSKFQEGKRSRLNSLNNSSKLSKRFTKQILQNEGFFDLLPDSSVETAIMTKILAYCEKLHLEKNASSNDSVSKRSVPDEKLDEILKVTENILKMLMELGEQFKESKMNGKLATLKAKCEEQMVMLREVEEERNGLQEKLFCLERLVCDQEDYLDSREAERLNEGPIVNDLSLPSSSSQ